ncbi:unnamed protein product, partial [Meganyctiphanes norvegica]
ACPNGFDLVENYCYHVGNKLVEWDESKIKCEEMNSKLAEGTEFLNSTEFANYIAQYLNNWGYYEYYEYDYDYGDGGYIFGQFSIGGQYINDSRTNGSWKWLSGEDVNYYVYDFGGTCLSVEYNFFEGNFYFYLDSRFCNNNSFSASGNRYYYGNPILLKYICQAEFENISYSSCEQDGTDYISGQLVLMEADQCQQSWCQDGVIIQYTCGNITTGC